MVKSADKIILEAEDYQFSGDDIKTLTDNKYDIFRYHELSKYDNIDQVLGENKGAIILFQNESANSGHWVGIYTEDNILYFFDSYGFEVDADLDYSQYNLKIHGGQKVPHLTHLIEKSNYKVKSNTYKFQTLTTETNTCGRYVALKLKWREKSFKEFNDILNNNKCYDSNFWVSALTGHLGVFENI